MADGWDPGASAALIDYRSRLEAALAGSARARAAIVAEVTDGLVEAAEAHRDRGLDQAAAARAAVAEFGDPIVLARLFAGVQASGAARRTGIALLATGPLVGLAWLAASREASGLGWLDQIGAVFSASPWLLAALGLAVPAAIVAVAGGGGPLMWRSGFGSGPVAGAAILATCAAMLADGVLLSGLALGRGPATRWSWVLGLAAAASVLRAASAAAAAFRCSRLRAAAR